MLRRSVEGGSFCYPLFVNGPLVKPLRREPEFSRLMRQTEQQHEQFKRRFFREASELRQPRRKSFLSEWLIETSVNGGCDITT